MHKCLCPQSQEGFETRTIFVDPKLPSISLSHEVPPAILHNVIHALRMQHEDLALGISDLLRHHENQIHAVMYSASTNLSKKQWEEEAVHSSSKCVAPKEEEGRGRRAGETLGVDKLAVRNSALRTEGNKGGDSSPKGSNKGDDSSPKVGNKGSVFGGNKGSDSKGRNSVGSHRNSQATVGSLVKFDHTTSLKTINTVTTASEKKAATRTKMKSLGVPECIMRIWEKFYDVRIASQGALRRGSIVGFGAHNSTTMEDDMSRTQQLTLSFVRHKFFEMFVCFLILGNALLMGAYAQWLGQRAASSQSDPEPPVFKVLERVFLVAFTLEITVRVFAERIEFIVGMNYRWNAFDLFLVVFGILEELVTLAFASSSVQQMRLLRVMRIVRVLRLVRVMRFFRELRLMIMGIQGSMRSLFWVLLLILLVVFMFSVYIVQIAGEELVQNFSDLEPKLAEAYGSMPMMMFTLFKTISGGENWGPIAAPLVRISPIYALFYVLFIAFTVFAVLNVVTGIFVETAMLTAQRDMDNVLLEEMTSYKNQIEELRAVFSAVDTDGSGTITWEEFSDHLQNEKVCAYFRKLGLDMHDPYQLFTLLDFDGDGEMCCDEFVEGFTQLKGQAKSLDLARVRHHVLDAIYQMGLLTQMCEEGFAKLGVYVGSTAIARDLLVQAGHSDKNEAFGRTGSLGNRRESTRGGKSTGKRNSTTLGSRASVRRSSQDHGDIGGDGNLIGGSGVCREANTGERVGL